MRSCSIRESLRPIPLHSLPAPTSFSTKVHAIPLFNSHTSHMSQY
jgi:hypothetical protein